MGERERERERKRETIQYYSIFSSLEFYLIPLKTGCVRKSHSIIK
jgi:hypothetical protein